MRGRMNRVKKTAAFLLLFILCFTITVPAYASGSGNVDGGGGSLNHGKEGYYWPDVGYDGVRVTVVDAQSGQRVSVPVDYTNVKVGTLPQLSVISGKSARWIIRMVQGCLHR